MISAAASSNRRTDGEEESNLKNGHLHPIFAAKIMALHLQKGKDVAPSKLGQNVGLRVHSGEIHSRHFQDLRSELVEAGASLSHTLRGVETVLSMLPEDAIQRNMLGTTGEHLKVFANLEDRLKTVLAQLRGVRSLHNPDKLLHNPDKLMDHNTARSPRKLSPADEDDTGNESEQERAPSNSEYNSIKADPTTLNADSSHSTPRETDSERNDEPPKSKAENESDVEAEKSNPCSTFWPRSRVPVSEKYMKSKFREMDATGDGIIEYEEAKVVLINEGVDPKRFIEVMQSFDRDGDGLITWPEFRKGMKDNSMWTRDATLLEIIFYTLEDPNSSGLAKCITVIVILCILISITLLVLESMPSFRQLPHEHCHNRTNVEIYIRKCDDGDDKFCFNCEPESKPFFLTMDMIIVPILTLEYFMRILTVHATSDPSEVLAGATYTPRNEVKEKQSTDKVKEWCSRTISYAAEPMNLIDFFSVLPFYLRLVLSAIENKQSGSGLDFLLAARILRMVRVFRVIRAGKSSEGLAMFGEVFVNSWPALKIIFFFVILSMIIFGCVIFEVEKGVWHEVHDECPDGGGCYIRYNYATFVEERSPFTSIPSAFWWVVVTQTTVGYGDLYPTSVAGKFTAFVVMLFGIINFALPITVLGANFADVYAKEEKLNEMFEEQNTPDEDVQNMWLENVEDISSSPIGRHRSNPRSPTMEDFVGPPRTNLSRKGTLRASGTNIGPNNNRLHTLRVSESSDSGATLRRGNSQRVHPEYKSRMNDGFDQDAAQHLKRIVNARILARRKINQLREKNVGS